MVQSWVTLLPTLVVLSIAVVTRNVLISLLCGIITACAIIEQGNIPATLLTMAHKMIHELRDKDHLFTFGFLLLLGILIELITRSGGTFAYSQIVRRFITGKRSTQFLSLFVSCTFFIDDYLNSLTTGAIMRPLTDEYRIPRVKLAYLLDSMSAALCVCIPATSWIAMILMQMQVSGISERANALIHNDPLMMYLSAIPFLYYPLFSIGSAFFVVSTGISYGTMHQQEVVAEKEGNLFGDQPPLQTTTCIGQKSGTLAHFFIPIITFIVSLGLCLALSGHFYLFGGENSLMQALMKADIFSSLFYAGLISVLISIALYVSQHIMSPLQVITAAQAGAYLMKNSFFVLFLAWTLSTLMKNDLQTGQYLAHLLIGAVSPVFLPVLFFITSVIISGSIGSAWGTIAIMLPIGIPLIASLSALAWLAPLIAAVVSGSVAGGHFSPITDSSVMASTSAGCYHLDHVRTQISYSLPALCGSIIAFLVAGVTIEYMHYALVTIISLVSGMSVVIALLLLRQFSTRI